MNEKLRTDFASRLKTAAEAKKAMLANFKPKPAVTDPNFIEREARKAAEIERVRQERADAKAAKLEAARLAAEAVRQTDEEIEAATLAAKRDERKARKAQAKAEARAKRDARSSGRKVSSFEDMYS